MKLESLSLENFGAFVGTHSVPLSVEKGKPIVLLGALNGSGKTTFLDQYYLYTERWPIAQPEVDWLTKNFG